MTQPPVFPCALRQTYTTFAFVLAIPIACVLEGPVIAEKWSEIVSTFSSNLPTFSAVVAGGSELRLSEMHLITGLFFYLYVRLLLIRYSRCEGSHYGGIMINYFFKLFEFVQVQRSLLSRPRESGWRCTCRVQYGEACCYYGGNEFV